MSAILYHFVIELMEEIVNGETHARIIQGHPDSPELQKIVRQINAALRVCKDVPLDDLERREIVLTEKI